ncbi:MAG: hypothetical protein NTZ13_01710 [Candidatus Parcubacteria bacterium]|nr:hypothetical protein [Candidatus Parcubacteria bacterium]
MNNDDIFADAPGGHACSKSVETEITIPGTHLVFCITSVSYENGKVDVVTSVETREKKRNDIASVRKEIVILKDHYTLDVSHIIPGPKTETEPINFHSHY